MFLKSKQICPNLFNFNNKIFAKGCGRIPRPYGTACMTGIYPVSMSLFCLSYNFVYLLYFYPNWDRS